VCRARWTRGESKIHSRTRSMQGVQGGGRRLVSREESQRVLVDVPRDVSRRTAATPPRARARAGLLELGSAYLRCAMHSLSLPTSRAVGKARRIPGYSRKKEGKRVAFTMIEGRSASRRCESESTPRVRPSRFDPLSVSFRLRATLEPGLQVSELLC